MPSLSLRAAPLLSIAALVACGTAPPPGAEPPRSVQVASSIVASEATSSAVDVQAPSQRASEDAVRARQTVADLDRCIAAPQCSRAQVAALVTLADDLGASGHCALFYAGVAVPKDWARARACYFREVTHDGGCGGSSPSLDRETLATMMLDGQGGAKESPATVSRLFEACNDDAGILFSFQTPDAPTGPVDFCHDIGGSTMSMVECARRDIDLRVIERELLRKDLAAATTAEGLAREEEASRSYDPFVLAASLLAGDDNRGGTMRLITIASVNESLLEERNRWIASTLDSLGHEDRATKALSVKRHDELLSQRLRESDPENLQMIREAEAAFLVYRNAEVAFARAAFASRGVAAAESAAFIHATDTWTNVLSYIHSN